MIATSLTSCGPRSGLRSRAIRDGAFVPRSTTARAGSASGRERLSGYSPGMTEWILLFTLNLVPASNELRDVSFTTISGFSSAVACEGAAKVIADRSVALVGRAREQRGIPGASKLMMPAINYECVQVRK